MLRSKTITGKLLELQHEIEGYAKHYGLDFFPQIFEVCDYDTINILAAQGGFPSRYPHWRFGMDYDQLSKGYSYGLQKIYEMVVNTEPCYAYLLEVNQWIDQKLVMAHVYGHNDFFKNNAWFSLTDRKMMDQMANHGSKIRRYMERFGTDRVEQFIDQVLSIENLLDPSLLFETPQHRRRRDEIDQVFEQEKLDGNNQMTSHTSSDALKSFMRAKHQEDRLKERERQEKEKKEVTHLRVKSTLKAPMRDILQFLMERAPLEDWEVDVIGILREEAYYFLPQRMTKIMNEGWASYWHSKIMTEKAMDASEVIDFADKHAGVMVMSKKNINPYKIGIELFRDIEYRWDTGRFGKEYMTCDSLVEREHWDTKTLQGRSKMFEVRRSHNDVSFIDEFFTEDFCERQKLFVFDHSHKQERFEIKTREFEKVKQKLLSGLTNSGQPIVKVVDDNYENRSELLLFHQHEGVDLDVKYSRETLQNLYKLWKRPVNLQTQSEQKNIVYRFDGREFKEI